MLGKIMNKALLAGVVVFGIFLSINSAFAAIDSFYTTDSNGSSTPKSTFNLNETPWLYVKLSDTLRHITSTWWNDPNGNSYDASLPGSNATPQWLTLSDWNTVKTPGKWNVNGSLFYKNGVCETAETNFTVTPEPISTTLFLLGSGALAVGQYRRKKKDIKRA